MTNTGEGVEKEGNRKDVERVIPATRRPDGSLRKERRVRAGYTAPEEVPVYVAPHIRARRARETAAAAAAAGTTKTTVDESELLSKLGKLKLDQSCPAKTPTQSPPSMQLQEDHPKDTKDKPQHKVRGRGKCTFSKYSADTDKRNENLD